MDSVLLKVDRNIKCEVREFIKQYQHLEKEFQPSSGEYFKLINRLIDAICETFNEQNKEIARLSYKLNYEYDSDFQEWEVHNEIVK